ncbi:hypothetical protein SNEBB_004057 [Seison nebaliae]|nr:hypothetical protein SNEBB_004057 [Seison nebaliae]
MNKFHLSIFILSICYRSIDSVRCYVCGDDSLACRYPQRYVDSSLSNYYLGREMHNVRIIDCPYSCWKNFHEGNITRGCSNAMFCRKTEGRSGRNRHSSYNDCCHTNLCNNSIIIQFKKFKK